MNSEDTCCLNPRWITMKRTFLFLIAAAATFANTSMAQLSPQWTGNWNGTMYIFNYGKLVDSVLVSFIVKPAIQDSSYTWRMEYHSVKTPMVKDYVLRTRDAAHGLFITDEGDGIELTSYLVGNKIYSLFEVQNTMLSACYELRGNELIFEVTSGKKEPATGGGVTTYSVKNLQRVVLKRMEKM